MKYIFMILTPILFIFGCGSSNSNDSSNFTAISTHKTAPLSTLSRSEESNIEFVKNISLNGIALDVALSNDGNYLYVASGDFGLQILDITDKYNPKLIGTYDSYGYVNHVEVIENIVYTSYIAQTWNDYESINAYDITTPSYAKYLGYHEGYKSNNHKIVDTQDESYFLNGKDFIVVNKLKNNYQNYRLFDPYALTVCRGFAYIANGRDGITIFKVLNISNSRLGEV